MPITLVDCGCEAKVYGDGSGIEIYYCPLHKAAGELLKALQDIVPFLPDKSRGIWLAKEIAKAAIAKATAMADTRE